MQTLQTRTRRVGLQSMLAALTALALPAWPVQALAQAQPAVRVGSKIDTEGLLLDPVYTGRAAAGLIDLIRQGFFKKGETVLFWHTGGQVGVLA